MEKEKNNQVWQDEQELSGNTREVVQDVSVSQAEKDEEEISMSRGMTIRVAVMSLFTLILMCFCEIVHLDTLKVAILLCVVGFVGGGVIHRFKNPEFTAEVKVMGSATIICAFIASVFF